MGFLQLGEVLPQTLQGRVRPLGVGRVAALGEGPITDFGHGVRGNASVRAALSVGRKLGQGEGTVTAVGQWCERKERSSSTREDVFDLKYSSPAASARFPGRSMVSNVGLPTNGLRTIMGAWGRRPIRLAITQSAGWLQTPLLDRASQTPVLLAN